MRPSVICLTPVKNEEWILSSFLKATSAWADFIIIADQGSTDKSREIASKYSKVILVENSSTTYNESERQNILIQEARKLPGNNLIITLDADEVFSPEFLSFGFLDKMINAKPNTVFYFRWANIRPGLKQFWLSDFRPFAFMDTGEKIKDESIIHATRIPVPNNHVPVKIDETKVIHLQYIDWNRMKSKHRWYQSFERISFPQKSPLDIFRMYHHMYSINSDNFIEIPDNWTEFLVSLEIYPQKINKINTYWWDERILNYFDESGISTFRKIAIWDANWNRIKNKWEHSSTKNYKDPRKILDRLIQWYLIKSQKYCDSYLIKRIDKSIKKYLNY